eukprot:5511777-Karenia_brevis.AAC.1
MAKAQKPRQCLAGPETLHMAHVLSQLDSGYFNGGKHRDGQLHRQFHDHALAAQSSTPQTTVAFVSRLEFQDGKRKTGTQRYHGRGTVHSHALDYLQNVDDIGLPNKMAAHIPSEEKPLLRGLVLDGQRDRAKSGWPQRDEPSMFDAEEGKLQLYHPENAYEEHVRGYFPEVLSVTKCHEDVLQGDGRGHLLRYVATYVD